MQIGTNFAQNSPYARTYVTSSTLSGQEQTVANPLPPLLIPILLTPPPPSLPNPRLEWLTLRMRFRPHRSIRSPLRVRTGNWNVEISEDGCRVSCTLARDSWGPLDARPLAKDNIWIYGFPWRIPEGTACNSSAWMGAWCNWITK